MELPTEVQIHNELAGIKGGRGTLVAVSPHGYYEVKCPIGGKIHRVLLPIQSSVLIFREPEPEFEPGVEIER